MAAFTSQTYTAAEQTEIEKWATSASSQSQSASFLDSLNAHLLSRTTILGFKPSTADIAVYSAVAPLVKTWDPQERTGHTGRPNIVRFVDYVQNATDIFGLQVTGQDKIPVDPEDVRYVKPVTDAKVEKEKLKKEKAGGAAVAGSGSSAGKETTLVDRTKQKAQDVASKVDEKVSEIKDKVTGKEKKDKAPKRANQQQKAAAPPAAAAAATLSPCLIDLRVGHILKAIKHPEADSLYVSTIAMGDPADTEDTTEYEGQVCRTVCSGLNGLVPLDEMQGRLVVVVANLKPVKMRGIKSCAMVLAASPRLAEGGEDGHNGPVELVSPPPGAAVGERLIFEGWAGEPDRVLNPKKKVWETIQPGFVTTDGLEVAFDAGVVKELGKDGVGRLVAASGGSCSVPSLKGAVVR